MRGAGRHLSVFWGPARFLQVPVRLAFFSHLLDVVQEEKPRARTRRWPEEEAPSIGGSDGRDGHEGFSGTPSAGILSAGHRLAGRKCPMDDHPCYIRGGRVQMRYVVAFSSR